MISLYQLRTFLEVARSGSVREAAERLVVSQPAVSSALATLQRDMGAALVERSGRGIEITAAGREVEREGRRLFGLIDEMQHRARAAASPQVGRVRLAAVTTAAEQLLPPLLKSFRAEHALLDVEIEVANRARVWDRLEHWEVDVAIGGRAPADRGFVTLATRPNELVVIGAMPQAGGVAELARATWLLREIGSGTREATEELFDSLAISPTRLTIGSNGAIRECVRAGLGISLLSREAVARDLQAGSLAIIPAPATPIARAWHLVGNAKRDASAAVRRFVEHAVATSAFTAFEA
jgi:DNA-binding transcriptional LysR family regulator